MERFEASMNQETVGCKVPTPSKRLAVSLHRFIGWSLQMNLSNSRDVSRGRCYREESLAAVKS